MKRTLSTLAATCLLAALAPFGHSADEPLLLHDSILEPQAHYFPSITYGVPTVHGVTFQQDGIITYKGWQYGVYYNAVGHVSVGRRHLPDGVWETLSLTDYSFTTVDSHNSVVLGIAEGDGTIHLSFDHHNDILKYRRSIPHAADDPETTAWTPDLFGPITDNLGDGTTVTDVTYPRFLPAPDGTLLFTYRDGGSGGGDEFLFEYNPSSGEWTRIGLYISRNGSYNGTFTGSSSSRNGYPDNTLFDANGRLHMTWCWRETPDPRSNHDIYYAYSDDYGHTWKNRLGASVAVADATPLRVDSPGLKVWDIPQNRNYINNSAMTVDSEGRVHVLAWHYPDSQPDQTSGFNTGLSAPARFHHYWSGVDGTWHRNETNLTGTRPKLAADHNGHLYLVYGGADNLRIATATPGTGWSDWTETTLSSALPQDRAREVNIVIDPLRWERDRILSVYAQETNLSGTDPTPLHVLDYHVSRSAVAPAPSDKALGTVLEPELSWTSGRGAVAHDLYFGPSLERVENATTSSSEYQGHQPSDTFQSDSLDQETRYYWRVDAVDEEGVITPGRIWSFETAGLAPGVSNQDYSRAYGGHASIHGLLNSASGLSADVVLYWGFADGEQDADAWQHAVDLGTLAPGPMEQILANTGDETLYFRFFAANEHGAKWSETTAIAPAREDLARWNHTSSISIDFEEEMKDLLSFPILVRFSPELTEGFSYSQFLSPPYGDLRFSNESGTQTLPYEVETWDAAGTSLVWVKVPAISGLTTIRAWWGSSDRSPPSPSEQFSVWSHDFGGVWHLDQADGFATDSSTHASAGTASGLATASASVIPGAAAFNGTSSQIRLDNSPALNPSRISIEAWIQTTQSGIAALVNKDQTSGGFARVWQFRLNDGQLQFIVFPNSSNPHTLTGNTVVTNGEWHHVAATWDGSNVRLYVDGTLDAISSFSGTLQSGQSNDVLIGRGENATPDYFQGSMDEIRLSQTSRSKDWIRASRLNQKPDSTFAEVASPVPPDLENDLLPDAWEMRHFNGVQISDGRAGTDTNGNGVPDLLAFASGSDPQSANSFPHVEIDADAHDQFPIFVYDQIAGGTGTIGTDYQAASLRYIPEFSFDLVTWISGSGQVEPTGTPQPLANGLERVTVRFTGASPEESGRLFARVRIEPSNQ